jgi:chromosome segregation ATPase
MATPHNGDEHDVAKLINKMYKGLMAQARANNNTSANILTAIQSTQATLNKLIESMADERDRRYEQEIDDLEKRTSILQNDKERLEQLLDGKKAAKVDSRSTADKIKAVVKEAKEEEKKSSSVDWKVVKTSMITALALGLMWSLVTYAPEIGQVIKFIFGR